jgi:hypothetical protein
VLIVALIVAVIGLRTVPPMVHALLARRNGNGASVLP